MKIKVIKATELQIDWLVAKCEGVELLDPHDNEWELCWTLLADNSGDYYAPSNDWAQGWPILTRERISRTIDHSGIWVAYWTDGYGEEDFYKKWMHCDRNELVAGLRCYVASKLGDEVDVPDDLA